MYGQKGFDLIKQLQRSSNALPHFDEESIRYIFEEMKVLFNQNHQDFITANGDSSIFPTIHVRHSILERNQKCILSYLYNRLITIRQMRWDFGSVLPNKISNTLYEPEIVWFNSYGKSLANYMKSLNDSSGVDLTRNITPPKALYLEVRCLKNSGKYEMENEIITLKQNYVYMLPRTQAEHLIRHGVLKLIKS